MTLDALLEQYERGDIATYAFFAGLLAIPQPEGAKALAEKLPLPLRCALFSWLAKNPEEPTWVVTVGGWIELTEQERQNFRALRAIVEGGAQ